MGVPMVFMLLRQSADVNAVRNGGATPLYLSATAGHDASHGAICRMLLRHRAHPDIANDEGETPFEAALSRAHVQPCQALVEVGVKFPAVGSPRRVPPFTE